MGENITPCCRFSLVQVSQDLGEPMVGIEISTLGAGERMKECGW